MVTYKGLLRISIAVAVALCAAFLLACQGGAPKASDAPQSSVSNSPAVRLNFRYEADVPPPAVDVAKSNEDRNVAVQGDFDSNRPQELLDRTITSPDKKHVVAVYHKVTDIPSEFRLDMYQPDGKLLRKLTSDQMAAHFPETIVWSPDSSTVAFVAMLRVFQPDNTTLTPAPSPVQPDAVVDANAAPQAPLAAPTPAAPTGILTFRTEQIYICSSDGSGLKPITENEGLIYFYYAWSPDSTMLAALATTAREWKYLDVVANSKNEIMVPQGRPRVVEKNGRERRLDDNLTSVPPVWSPDSSKVAAAFGNQIRIYDAAGSNPTQAAIPLRNQLLISSQAYDVAQKRQSQAAANAVSNEVPAATPDQPLSTLPDEKDLVSYNPVVEIRWTAEDMIYLQTAYVKRMKNEADSARSFARWHRLILSAQPDAAANRR